VKLSFNDGERSGSEMISKFKLTEDGKLSKAGFPPRYDDSFINSQFKLRAFNVFNFIDPLFYGVFTGFILGLEVSWLLTKITWLDMRFKTEIFIPLGILIGLVGGLFVLMGQVPRKILKSIFILLLPLSFLTAVTFLKNLEAAWFVVPIIVKNALGLKTLVPLNFWFLLLFLSLVALLRLCLKSAIKGSLFIKKGKLEK
jgi:hypothetical protein